MGLRAATAIAALIIVGCGSAARVPDKSAPPTTSALAHPHAVEPVAGHAPTPTVSLAKSTPLPPGSHPTGPATVTKAPAKGAPTDAEVRAAVAQFKRAIATYHLNKLNLSGVLLNQSQLPPGPYQVSIASVYTDYGLPIACGGVLHVPQLGVANKTLPCGTEVTFIYNGRAIRVPVIDRGPYIAGREWDLTGATAEALHFPGLGPIYWTLG
jgi:rare lipoprotein A (peptidoglycan hydrolase)